MKALSTMVPSKSEFDSTIQEILQRPQYRHLKSGSNDFIQRIREAIKQWLEKSFENIHLDAASIPSAPDGLSTIFMIVGLLSILTIMIGIIVKVSKTFEKKSRVKEILGEKIDDQTTPKGLRRKASAFEKQGDFRQAIRYDFIALLFLMHEKGLLYLEETKTNEEIYNYLRRKGFFMLSLFKDMINTFNSAWYGHKLCNKDIYEKWNSNINLLWNGVINYEEKGK